MPGTWDIAVNCPNRRVITLDEWDAIREEVIEEEQKEDVEDELEHEQEEVKEAADEGEMLVLREY